MPSAITHFVAGAAIALPLGDSKAMREVIDPKGLAVVSGLLSIAPDLDVLQMGVIPYAHFWGHRGFPHSPFFLTLVGLVLSTALYLLVQRVTAQHWRRLSAVFVLSLVSHPLLDCLTDGGLGVMQFYPFSDGRFFFPWQPIRVSPISVSAFLSGRAVPILLSELPFAVGFAAAALALRRALRRRGAPGSMSV